MNGYEEFFNPEHAEAMTRVNYYPVEPDTCDVEGCDALAVPGETHECAEHQIITCIEIMQNIINQPVDQMADIDCRDYGVCQREIERLRAL